MQVRVILIYSYETPLCLALGFSRNGGMAFINEIIFVTCLLLLRYFD